MKNPYLDHWEFTIDIQKKQSNVFLEKLTGNLNKTTNSNTTGIIAGDFNYDILQYEYNMYSKGT